METFWYQLTLVHLEKVAIETERDREIVMLTLEPGDAMDRCKWWVTIEGLRERTE